MTSQPMRYVVPTVALVSVPNWVAALPKPDSWHGVVFDDGLPVVEGRYGSDCSPARGVMHFRRIPDDLDAGGHAIDAAVTRDDCNPSWLDLVMPTVLASDAIDAMTKLRLAARWAEAKGRG